MMSAKNNNSNENTLGERIKFYRKRLGMSQFDVEAETGIASGSLSRIERDLINPTKETLVKLGIVLQLSQKEIAYLFQINLYLQSQSGIRFQKHSNNNS